MGTREEMGKISFDAVKYKTEDHMLLGSIYDNIMLKTKYKDEKLSFLYNVMIAQKHRMLYYKMLKKRYLKKCLTNKEWEHKKKINNTDTIWMCWLQGFDNAPLIVRRCVESIQQNIPDKKVILVDANSIAEYIEMPDYILNKWKKGIIGNAHFTDLVRLELLLKYGGYWIDATVLCTDASVLKYLDKEPLFMYSFYYFGFNPEIMTLNNWFIHSCTNNNILALLREMLYCYWREKDRAVDYFLTHLFLTMALEHYKEEFDKMPIISQVGAHVLATYIYDDFNQDKYELLKQTTGFHKLSTRFEMEKLESEGNFYDVIIKQGKY